VDHNTRRTKKEPIVINFNQNYNINGTHHIGCFYVPSNKYEQYKRAISSYYPNLWRYNQMTFEGIVGRLYHVANYDIFEKTNRDTWKTSFQIVGMYKGKIFTLYDYEGDRMIHIGGHHGEINVENFTKDLIQLINATKPLSYEASSGFIRYHY
jgi:hypothetical protein